MSKIPGPSRIPTFGPRRAEPVQNSNITKSITTKKDLIDNVFQNKESNFLEYIPNEKSKNNVLLHRENSLINSKYNKNRKPYSKNVENSNKPKTLNTKECEQKQSIQEEIFNRIPSIDKIAQRQSQEVIIPLDEQISYGPIKRTSSPLNKKCNQIESSTRSLALSRSNTFEIETTKCLDLPNINSRKNDLLNNLEDKIPLESISLEAIKSKEFSLDLINQPFLIPSDVQMFEPSTSDDLKCLEKEIKCQKPTTLNLEEFVYSKDLKKNLSALTNNDEEQRDSLDMDESLGILTPDQMKTSFLNFSDTLNFSKTLESYDLLDKEEPKPPLENCSQLSSPNLLSAEGSVGIFDRKNLTKVTLICDTTINLELSYDATDTGLVRLEQTPSPEELPLDPTPVIEIDPKTEPSKSKTSNSFVTSVTSITSIDTGYQGDGEMSRPGSRAAENSPLTRRPVQRPQPRRPDPMTDSDFYTESDVDNHEENVIRGDRKAQVIDGTLYGVDPQKAADIYVNNRETMDSSGIFTDIETRTEDLLEEPMNVDVSPSEVSSKTVSENSQNNIQQVRAINSNVEINKENIENKKRSTQTISNNSSPLSRENSGKKHKSLKKEINSKVKNFIEPPKPVENEKKTVKKAPGRWDAVLNKISKTDHTINIKDVKSKVFNSSSVPNELRKVSSARQISAKTPLNKLRRVRSRALPIRDGGSNNSSLSDLSASPPKKAIGSTKLKESPQVTQVLTASKLTPKVNSLPDAKTAPLTPTPQNKSSRTRLFQNSANKNNVTNNITRKEFGRNSTKGGKASPTTKAPTTKTVTKAAPKTTEALAVLVQHLVFNIEAFQAPVLKRQVQKLRQQKEQIEQELAAAKQQHNSILEDHQLVKRNEIAALLENQCRQINEVINEKNQLENRLIEEYEFEKQALCERYENEIKELKDEYINFQKTHESFVNILREENDAIREEMEEKSAKLRDEEKKVQKLILQLQEEGYDLKHEVERLRNDNKKLREELSHVRQKQREESQRLEEENSRLLDENNRLKSYGEGKGVDVREVESIRAVLDLKIKELADLRQICAKATHKAEMLANCEEKNTLLQAKCEDLQHQLERKTSYELALLSENKKLEEAMKEDMKIRRRLSQKNEELQWQVQQNKEIITKIVEQTNDAFSRSGFSDLPSSTPFKTALDFTISNLSSTFNDDAFQDASSKDAKKSRICLMPETPKVKGVVEKSDSVSYVLDLHESPDVIASRIVRRSFRNSTPPRNTPIRSPSTKRTKVKSGSSQCSEDEIMGLEVGTPQHFSKKHGRCRADFGSSEIDENFDLNEDIGSLPAIPTGLGSEKSQALPSPKYLANEESCSLSSDDECTSSSSGQL